MFRQKLKTGRGFTMVEMLIAMAIAAIFLSIFIGVVLATFQTLRTGDERTVAQQNARVAMRYIVQDLKDAVEISPRRFEEPYDPVYGDLPRDENSINQFDPSGTAFAYPIYRRSTDSDDLGGDSPGYIDLSHSGASGDGDEYIDFRLDGRPFDIRPLAPNRLELLENTDTYFSHTQYWGDDPETPGPPDIRSFNLDLANGGAADNTQSLKTRVTYEHQIAPPKEQIYVNEFDANQKDFRLPVNRNNSEGVRMDEDFCLVRSVETELMNDGLNSDVTVDSELDPNLNVDSYAFRQPLADHIIDIRFRYWHIDTDAPIITSNTRMLEIRYDPDISHASQDPNGGSGTPISTDDGYFRYFTPRGQEIFVWYNYDAGAMVQFWDDTLSDPTSNIDMNSFVMQYLDPPPPGKTEIWEQGYLLFEGWRFINMVSVTVRATNRENLNLFKKSIDHTWNLRTDPDYGMGFVDFGKGAAPPTGIEDNTNPNTFEPLYRSVDSYRTNTVTIAGNTAWDFVEPNLNPNYEPGSFVTLEMFVVPPIIKAISDQSALFLTHGFNYKGTL